MTELTADERNRLPKDAFAVPLKRAYPIPTPAMLRRAGVPDPVETALNHARNALARVAQHGSPAEKNAVCRMVSERYPQIHTSHCSMHGGRARYDDPMGRLFGV